MKNTIISLVVVVIIIVGGWYMLSLPKSGDSGDLVAGSVAMVNDESISLSDLELVQLQIVKNQNLDVASLSAEELAELKAQALDALISQTLLHQATVSSGVTVTQADINAQMEVARGQFENEAAFIEAITSQGLTEEVFQANLERELTIQAYLFQTLNLSSITATEVEIKDAYETAVQGAEDAPTLEESHDQIASFVINQKQQDLINQHIQELRSTAEIVTQG